MTTDSFQREIDVLRLLLRATEAEKVRWIQDNGEEYHSDDLANCYIRFFYVSLSDGEAEFNDRDRVEVSVGEHTTVSEHRERDVAQGDIDHLGVAGHVGLFVEVLAHRR